jgi:hypothetical protein
VPLRTAHVSFAPLACRYALHVSFPLLTYHYALHTCSNAPLTCRYAQQTPNSEQNACFPPSALKDVHKKRSVRPVQTRTAANQTCRRQLLLSPTYHNTTQPSQPVIVLQGSLSGTAAVLAATPKPQFLNDVTILQLPDLTVVLYGVSCCCVACVCVTLDLPR